MHDELQELLQAGYDAEDRGELDAAVALYERARALFVSSPKPLLCLGNVAFLRGEVAESKRFYLAAVSRGESPAAELNLGNIALDESCYHEALERYSAALRMRPEWPEALFGSACALHASNDYANALKLVERLLVLDPAHDQARRLQAELLRPQGALLALGALAKIEQWDAKAYALAAALEQILLNHSRSIGLIRQAIALDPTNDKYYMFLFFASMLDQTVDSAQLADWVRDYARVKNLARVAGLRRRSGSKIRIGYLSGDFRNHAAAKYLMPLFRHHRRDRFTVYALANVYTPDTRTDDFRRLADHWVDLTPMTDQQATNYLRNLELDIIVDCSGQSTGNRLMLLHGRIAPLQATTIGVALTSGIPNIDIRITGSLTDPLGIAEPWHSERLVRIGDMQVAYESLRPIHYVADLPLRRNRYITFGYFNNAIKLTAERLELIRRLMEAKANARFIFVGVDNPDTRSVIEGKLADALAQGRIEINGRVDSQEFDELISRTDIAIDSFPYTGATTTLECLLAGVPVATMFSEKAASRASYSILTILNLQQWIYSGPDALIAGVCAIAEDVAALQKLRSALPGIVLSSELFNYRGFIEKWEGMLQSELDRVPLVKLSYPGDGATYGS